MRSCFKLLHYTCSTKVTKSEVKVLTWMNSSCFSAKFNYFYEIHQLHSKTKINAKDDQICFSSLVPGFSWFFKFSHENNIMY